MDKSDVNFCVSDFDDTYVDEQIAMRMSKAPNGKWICTECNALQRDKTDARRHIEAVHLKLKIKCPYCNVVLKARHLVRHHIRKSHAFNPEMNF